MDYEKKYKEALERARALNEGKTTGAFGETVCEYIFPELKESEDERIRKQILAFLKEFERDHYRNLDFSSWITWVEKQKLTWSEKDDYYRENLITWLNCGVVRVDLRKDFIDWLNSIKKRMEEHQ